jgi:hypothetical protein
MRIATMRSLLPTVIALCLVVPIVQGFSPLQGRATTRASSIRAPLLNKISPDNDSDFAAFPDETEYSGSIDWDAEWKKVVKEKKTMSTTATKERPGSGYYKSEAEIAAIVRR